VTRNSLASSRNCSKRSSTARRSASGRPTGSRAPRAFPRRRASPHRATRVEPGRSQAVQQVRHVWRDQQLRVGQRVIRNTPPSGSGTRTLKIDGARSGARLTRPRRAAAKGSPDVATPGLWSKPRSANGEGRTAGSGTRGCPWKRSIRAIGESAAGGRLESDVAGTAMRTRVCGCSYCNPHSVRTCAPAQVARTSGRRLGASATATRRARLTRANPGFESWWVARTRAQTACGGAARARGPRGVPSCA